MTIAHIFGVNIDPQAVEVSKLSLLLKVLEGETDLSVMRQMQLFQERALPSLADNIKSGNSLIGPNYFTGKLISDADELKRVNPFDWKTAFPEAMRTGGFDCIIGNPPYIRIQTMKEWATLEVEIYKDLYKAARQGNYDIYVVFLERGLQLLNAAGRLGFICPHKFFNAKYGEAIRSIVADGKHLAGIVHFGDQQVFDGATTYTCLLFLDNSPTRGCQFTKVDSLARWRTTGVSKEGFIRAKEITASDWNFAVGAIAKLQDKLAAHPVKLAALVERIAQGIRTSANEVYVLGVVRETRDVVVAHSSILDEQVKLERRAVVPFLQGREIKRYRLLTPGKVVIIPYELQHGRAALIPEKEIAARYPLVNAYLRKNKDYLVAREDNRMRGPGWYGYIYPKNLEIMRSPKILVPDIADRASFALDENGDYAFTSGYGITLRSGMVESVKYILGLLNSSLLNLYLRGISTTMRGGFFRYFTQFLEQLPIRRIEFAKPKEKAAHDRIVRLVDSMLSLHKQHATANSASKVRVIQGQIDATEREVDRLVYELYDLTVEEIAIVEETGKH